MKTILIPLCAIIGASCSNMTPEQKAQWSTTANSVANRAANLALDEGATRLRESRKHSTSDAKDSTVNDGP